MKSLKKYRGVYERPKGSNIWWICYHDAKGKKRREKVGRLSAAIELYRKRKTEVLERKKLPEKFRAKPVSFGQIAADALVYSRNHKASYEHDEMRLKRMLKTFKDHPADAITPQQISRWLEAQTDEHEWEPATFNRYRALFSLVFKLALNNGKVASNPARLVRQKRENNEVNRFLTDVEETTIRNTIRRLAPHREAELDLALHTGMRLGEQHNLCWKSVDLERRIMTLRKDQTKNGRAVISP
jgi:site-specific recombinase XerD